MAENDYLNEQEFSDILEKLGFISCKASQFKSTNPLWEGFNSGKKYFIKMARKGTQNFTALSLEFLIFHSLNPGIGVLRFEFGDYLITATEELSPVIPSSTGDVFELINRYESKLLKMQHIIPTDTNLDLLINFSREAVSYFQLFGQLGASWISRFEKDLGILNDFFHQTNQVIVHGDVSPVNILNSDGELILIDWGDAFWAFRGFDHLYWLTFLQNSSDLTRSNIEKLNLDIEVCQSTLNMIILLKEFLHRNSLDRPNRFSLSMRLESAQFLKSRRI